MPVVKITSEEWQVVKSGLYNANSALQRLRTEVHSLSLTVNRLEMQEAQAAGNAARLNELQARLEAKGLV